MEKFKYYLSDVETNVKVSYCYLDENGTKFKIYNNYGCFSTITYGKIPDNAQKILTFRNKKTIPYEEKIIKKWIKELNELGFPCSFSIDNEDENIYNFYIDLKDYKYKMHINCTLQLIRAMFESYIAYVVEFYFQLIEKANKTNKIDKFIALQDAHKELHKHNCSIFFNTNHTITSKYNKNNVTKEQFLKNIENTEYGVYSDDHTRLDLLWDG